MDSKRIELLRKLVDGFGPSGFEREVTAIVAKTMRPIADEITVDKLGSVQFSRKGTSDRPKILITGHVDEVGFGVVPRPCHFHPQSIDADIAFQRDAGVD